MLLFFSPEPSKSTGSVYGSMDSVWERVYSDHDVDKENRSFQIENLIVISLDFQGSDGTDHLCCFNF